MEVGSTNEEQQACVLQTLFLGVFWRFYHGSADCPILALQRSLCVAKYAISSTYSILWSAPRFSHEQFSHIRHRKNATTYSARFAKLGIPSTNLRVALSSHFR